MIDFNEIRELPVSEEWIAAYLDGKLDSTTSAFVESNLIDSSEHVDFVESLEEIWDIPEISITVLGTSEMDLSEALIIDSMSLPTIGTANLLNDLNTFDSIIDNQSLDINSPDGMDDLPAGL